MLELNDLTKRFGPTTAVDSLSLVLNDGEMVGVIGRSGAGKSTLLRLINRLVEPTAGRILHDGKDVTRLSGRELRMWRARCGMIFQQFNLVDRLDVLTNVLIGRIAHHGFFTSMPKWFTAAERTAAIHALDRLDMVPQALQRAGTLSGGQQQRVAIAKALLQEPQIMLADEPIASLDPANATRVMEALRRINREDGITVVVNLHSLEMARRYCDRIVAMRAGLVVFDGPPAELTDQRVLEIYGQDGLDPFEEAATKNAIAA